MYYRDLETSLGAKLRHNKTQKQAATDRLKSNAARRKAAKGEKA